MPDSTSRIIFLSHSTKDQWISERMKEKIEEDKEAGLAAWLDAIDLPAGQDLRRRIREGLQKSSECVILYSPASRDSDWVKHEMGMADGMGIENIVIVLLHLTKDDVPEPLRDRKFISINDFSDYVKHLVAMAKLNKEKA